MDSKKIVDAQNTLQALRQGNSTLYKQLYAEAFPTVRAFVVQNRGSASQAEDVFQDALLVFQQKLTDPAFSLTASPKTYLFAVAKNIWMSELRKQRQQSVAAVDGLTDQLFNTTGSPENDQEEQLSGWLRKITLRCQAIINALFFEAIPMKRLMQHMGWKNAHTAANQQYKCLQQVKKQKEKN